MVEINGLTTKEAEKKLEIYGYNAIPELKPNQVLQFLKKFWGVTPIMLEGTVILEWLIGKQVEALIILALLFFNALVGYFQERKTNSALMMLKKHLQIEAKVRRDNQWISIPAKMIVPGDLMRVRSGDFIGADAQIIDGKLNIDQSSLTGESFLIQKSVDDIIYSGSIVRRGEATTIVSATGPNTKFGKTIELVQIARPKLHIQHIITNVVKILLIIVLISMSVIIIVSLIKNEKIFESLPLLVLLLVTAIPVALPTMFTISMALGSQKLSKSGILITRLDAIDDASAMNILCVDKTGTITLNRQRITDVIPLVEYSNKDVIIFGALASEAADQDPIDMAFISKFKELEVSTQNYERIEFVPFDPKFRRTEALVKIGEKDLYIMKGAINEIFKIVNEPREKIVAIQQKITSEAPKDHKLIAVAAGETKENLKLVGIAIIFDEIRSDTSHFISELEDLGVSLKMLTGDALFIALDVAESINLGTNIKKVSDLKSIIKEKGSQDLLESVNGFAEIYPEDKYLIVKRFQELGHIVGMTGDGINDAPALKQAEVGIAVSNATDVAKSSASVVLTVEGLEGIVELIKNGRMIFQRVLIWIMNKIIKTFYAVIFIILAYLILGVYVVSAIDMILFLFLTDYVTLSIATDNVEYPRRPETWNILREMILGFIMGIFIIIEGFGLLYFGNLFFGVLTQISKLHTFIFSFLIFIGYFSLLSVRENKHFWSSKPSKFLMISIVINILIVFIICFIGFAGFAVLSLGEITFVFLYCLLSSFLINDFIKYGVKKYFALRFNVN